MKSEEEEAAEAAAIEAQEFQLHDATPKSLQWVDITQFLRDTKETMEGGQMIHSPSFSLFRSMSAVEIGDPKMDPGLYHTKIMTVHQAVDRGLLPASPSSLQILSIMDELMACEVSWFSGDPLSTSLLTCLYLHDPNIVQHPLLKGYVNMVIKCCQEARSVILTADLFEEEDFVPHTYGFSFGDDVPFEEALNEAKRIEADLEQQIRIVKQQLKTSNATDEKVHPSASNEETSENIAVLDALLCRFRFRKALVQLHSNLRKPDCRGVHAAEKLIARASAELQVIEDSLSLAERVPAPGFDKFVTRNLVPHAPPRQARVRSRAQGVAYYRSMLLHLNKLLVLPQLKTFDEILSFVMSFSALYNPGIVARSHLVILLGGEKAFLGKGALCDWLQQSFLLFCDGTRFSLQQGELWKWFIDRVAKPMWCFLRVYSANRPRQRRRVGKLLPDLSVLQDDSSVLDQRAMMQMIHAGYNLSDPKAPAPCRHACFVWVLEETLNALIHYLFLGFELELYSLREFPMIYW